MITNEERKIIQKIKNDWGCEFTEYSDEYVYLQIKDTLFFKKQILNKRIIDLKYELKFIFLETFLIFKRFYEKIKKRI